MNRLTTPLAIDIRIRTFSLVLGLVFLFRAMIPIGYMPDAKSGASSVFSLSLCITGLSAATVHALALDTGSPQTEPPVLHCAFTLANSDPPPLPALINYLHLLPVVGLARFVQPDSARMSWLISGPPLGARAPPAGNYT